MGVPDLFILTTPHVRNVKSQTQLIWPPHCFDTQCYDTVEISKRLYRPIAFYNSRFKTRVNGISFIEFRRRDRYRLSFGVFGSIRLLLRSYNRRNRAIHAQTDWQFFFGPERSIRPASNH